MRNVNSKNLRIALVVFAAMFCFVARSQVAFGQQIGEAERLNELRRLHDQLQISNSLRDADAVVVIGERAILEAAQRLVGLEILLSNGSTLRLTSVEGELKPAAAILKVGLQAKSSVTVNLQLIGRINSGEVEKDALRLPLQVTEVKLMSGRLSSLFLKTLFGEWLKPETWNDELPAIELPLEMAEALQIPANRFEVAGEMPMEISTPAYQSPLKFAVTSLLTLDKRVAIALRLDQGAPAVSVVQTSFAGASANDPAALESEIARMSEGLTADSDLRLRFNRRVVNALLTQIAVAQNTDFDLRLKRGRLRTEEVTAIVKVTNYTDVESGAGRVDISQLNIERIADGKINLRLSGQGELDAKLRGREYGIPYGFSPHITFVFNDQNLPLEFASEGERIILRAAPGSTLPISVRFSTTVAGREVGINRNSVIPADRWLNRIELPTFFGREFSLPRRMEVDAGGNLYVTEKQALKYTLRNLRLSAKDDAIEIRADVKVD
ncbi:MAG: hypothetical protein ACRD9Y_24340 [Blastocatellia bacterium]